MANLFAQTGTKKDSLVEFRAGLLWKDKDSAWVRPDKRKGQVIVKRGTDDQLIHFMWKDRAAGSTELDLILFPDDATWRRVKECTTGRVYVLEFKTGNKNFFWMQEPSTSKDDEYSDLINDHINNKAPQSAGNAGLQSLFGQLGPGAGAAYDELSQASAGYGRSSTPSATRNTSSTTTGSGSSTTTTTTSSSSNSAASSLSSRLADVMNRLPSGSGAAAAPSGPGAPRLTDVLNTTDVLATGALEDKDVLAELQKLLPENEQNSVIQTLRSPQFRQAVDHLNAVLKQSPQALSTLLTSFGVAQPSEPASNRLETFLRAIMEASKKETDKKDDSNKMDESK